jgi:hypothetical protein
MRYDKMMECLAEHQGNVNFFPVLIVFVAFFFHSCDDGMFSGTSRSRYTHTVNCLLLFRTHKTYIFALLLFRIHFLSLSFLHILSLFSLFFRISFPSSRSLAWFISIFFHLFLVPRTFFFSCYVEQPSC